MTKVEGSRGGPTLVASTGCIPMTHELYVSTPTSVFGKLNLLVHTDYRWYDLRTDAYCGAETVGRRYDVTDEP